jgi:hypothetical protein
MNCEGYEYGLIISLHLPGENEETQKKHSIDDLHGAI